MNEIIEKIMSMNLFWLEWIPALIVVAFIIISILSIWISIVKKWIALIILVLIINILAWLWIFEMISNLK